MTETASPETEAPASHFAKIAALVGATVYALGRFDRTMVLAVIGVAGLSITVVNIIGEKRRA